MTRWSFYIFDFILKKKKKQTRVESSVAFILEKYF